MDTAEYGKRTCLECGAACMPAYPAQVTCSVTCRKACEGQRHAAKRQRLKKRGRSLERENARLRERLKLCGVSL